MLLKFNNNNNILNIGSEGSGHCRIRILFCIQLWEKRR